MKSEIGLAVIGWVLVLGGGLLAHLVQTSDGVEIADVRFEFEPGRELSALIYRPAQATPENPAPGILAVHGYINSRETQSGFAVEFARRGYVVLAIDQTGHGFSAGTAFSAGFGGPAALRYLRALPYVDVHRIGLEGHSMGGWASLAAAADQPESYRAIALVGSSTGAPFAPEGSPSFPRNLGVVFSQYDEFAQLMWGVDDAREVAGSAKLQATFGARAPIEPGRLYGSINDGTARWLSTPATTHPGDHLSRDAIAEAIAWMDLTLGVSSDRAAKDQIWFWKELGTLVAFVGGIFVLLGSFALLLGTRSFSVLAGPGAGVVARADRRWWMNLAVITAVPALTYFPLTGLGAAFTANALFPQGITNQILVWALGNALIVLVLGRLLPRAEAAGPQPGWFGRHGVLAVIAALVAVLVLYLSLLITDVLFSSDFRFWVVALKLLAPHHFTIFLAYLLGFTAFFYVTQTVWFNTMSLRSGTAAQYVSTIAANVAGLLIMLIVIYAYLFARGQLPAVDPLFSIVAIQFVPVLTITSLVAVFAWRRTGDATAGAVTCGTLVTWYIVAGQATHVGI